MALPIQYLIFFSIFFIFVLSAITYHFQNIRYKKKHNTKLPITHFINGTEGDGKLHMKDVLFGAIFGLVFGFVDNFFLFVGFDSLHPYMPNEPILRAGLSNTFSDMIGATAGTYMAVIGKEIFFYDDDMTPVWSTTFGILIGCLMGLYIPYYLRKYLIKKY